MMNRWGFYTEGGAVHRDWRSMHTATSLSPLGLGRGEMAAKKTVQPNKKDDGDGEESAFSLAMQRQRDFRALKRKAQTKLVRVTDFGTALPGEDESGLFPELNVRGNHDDEEH